MGDGCAWGWRRFLRYWSTTWFSGVSRTWILCVQPIWPGGWWSIRQLSISTFFHSHGRESPRRSVHRHECIRLSCSLATALYTAMESQRGASPREIAGVDVVLRWCKWKKATGNEYGRRRPLQPEFRGSHLFSKWANVFL